MNHPLRQALVAGYEALASWADLLDHINVFPVADGDTGANLRRSLAPLRDIDLDGPYLIRSLAANATGNSGNIAAAFFLAFCRTADQGTLGQAIAQGQAQAWLAVAEPRAGTMLDLFDCLTALGREQPDPNRWAQGCQTRLAATVQGTTDRLPDLKRAGVVDSGALGMYLVFEALLRSLCQWPGPSPSPLATFAGHLTIRSTYCAPPTAAWCVNVTLDQPTPTPTHHLGDLGDSVVTLNQDGAVRLHIHTKDPEALRHHLDTLGQVRSWQDEPLTQLAPGAQAAPPAQAIHLMSDAAGSLPRSWAWQHNITLLDSYVLSGEHSGPESLFDPARVYDRLRRGHRVSTAQASTAERHRHYAATCARFGPTLYLCVGSAFTGNVAAAQAWQRQADSAGLLTVIDTKAASGRLGLITLLAARYASQSAEPAEVLARVEHLLANCQEYLFIHELKYLVAGGRVSRVKGLFGDLLGMKPVLHLGPDGLTRAGVCRHDQEQLAMAVERIHQTLATTQCPTLLVQYTDNEPWIRRTVVPTLQHELPRAEILVAPLSLTSGVHMGPGTWALAFAEEA